MLKFKAEQIKVFEDLQFLKLKQQIANELSTRVDEWKQFDAKKKTELVDYLFTEATNAKMVFEIEYILFSLLCISSENDCKLFLKDDEVQDILSDEDKTNPEKLVELSNLTSIEIHKKNNGWKILRRKK